jgi:asparagine synthase (glutamine-hydrolysing)
VRSRLVADVPVGVFLSGGLDSSIVAAIAARHVSQIDTFSIGFQSREHDESPYAKSLAEHIGSTHHHFIFDESKFIELLPQVVAALDEPIGDQAMLPLFWLCREARKHVTVALSGEGADEIFGGYSYYAQFANKIRLRDRLFAGRRQKVVPDLDRLIQNRSPVTPSGFPLLTDQADREYLTGRSAPEMDEWERGIMNWLNRSSNPLQRASCADIATWLPDDLLVKFDRMAMTNSLEGRAPYLQPDLMHMGICRLAADDRMANGVSKVALRRIACRWVPDHILSRRKQGFVLPMRTWISQWLSAEGGAEKYFTRKPVPGTLTDRVIQMVNADLRRGVHRERLLFALLVLAEWHITFKQQVRELRNRYDSTYKDSPKITIGCGVQG